MSTVGQNIVREREGLRLAAYPDPASKDGNPWTIGYGHTKGVKRGDTCTSEQAEAWLQEDWAEAQSIVAAAVTSPLTEEQLGALTSFTFNVGHGEKGEKDGFVELRSGQPSTMLRKLNAGDYLGAAAQFDLWNKAGGHVLSGLVTRRKMEKALFLAGTHVGETAFDQPSEEKPMAPLLAALIPSLIEELPNFAKIFQNKNVAERNVEAVTKAADLIVKSVPGAVNLQDAVEKIQTDPDAKAAANEAVKLNTADILDIIERTNAMEQKNIQAARDYNAAEPLFIDTKWVKLKFIHLLSLVFVSFSGVFVSMNWASLTAELKGAVVTLMVIAGWNGVRDYWMGSSEGSNRKTQMLLDRSDAGR